MFIEGILTAVCIGHCASDNRINNGLLAGFSVSENATLFVGSWENSQHHDSVVAGAILRSFTSESDRFEAGTVVGYGGFRSDGPSHVRSVPIAAAYADVQLYGRHLRGRITFTPELHSGPQAVFSIRWEQ